MTSEQIAIDFLAASVWCRFPACGCPSPTAVCKTDRPRHRAGGSHVYEVFVTPAGRREVEGWSVVAQASNETEAVERARTSLLPELKLEAHRAAARVHRGWRIDDPDCPWKSRPAL